MNFPTDNASTNKLQTTKLITTIYIEQIRTLNGVITPSRSWDMMKWRWKKPSKLSIVL